MKYLLLLILAACVSTKPGEVVSPPSGGADLPAPNKGWEPAYSTYIVEHVTDTMLKFPAPSFCPKWASLNDAEKRDFWAAVLESTAYAESGFNRLNMYREDSQSVNGVTGKRNVSEGLLQVSYGDWECPGLFDYEKDKAGFLEDYASLNQAKNQGEGSSKHPERSILNPYINLQCGINIWDALIKKKGNAPALTSIGLLYWSTLNPGGSSLAGKTKPYFKTRIPKCF